MAKSTKTPSRKAAPWHPWLVLAMAGVVFALPWPGGAIWWHPWVRLAAGMLGSLLFYLIGKWALRDGPLALQATLILLSFPLWPAMGLTVLFAPVLLSLVRRSRPYMRIWALLLVLFVFSLLLPVGRYYAGLVLLLPAALLAAKLLGLWGESFKGKRKGKMDFYLFAFNAVALAAVALFLAGWICVSGVWKGSVPMLSGLLIGVTALGVVLLSISALVRRQPLELVTGGVLFCIVWHLLRLPQLDIFL